MIKEHNNKSLALGIPGFIVNGVGYGMQSDLLLLIGAAMLIAGFGYYAKAKGRSPWWGFLALFSIFGILVLAVLKDKSNDINVTVQPNVETQST